MVAAEVEPGAEGPENLAALLHAQLAVDEDVNHRETGKVAELNIVMVILN